MFDQLILGSTEVTVLHGLLQAVPHEVRAQELRATHPTPDAICCGRQYSVRNDHLCLDSFWVDDVNGSNGPVLGVHPQKNAFRADEYKFDPPLRTGHSGHAMVGHGHDGAFYGVMIDPDFKHWTLVEALSFQDGLLVDRRQILTRDEYRQSMKQLFGVRSS